MIHLFNFIVGNSFCFVIIPVSDNEKFNKVRTNVKNIGGGIFLGQLYDGTRDARIPGEYLWRHYDNRTEQNATMVEKVGWPTKKVRDEMFEEHSMLDRINKFDFDMELKLSFMGGLIEVEGR